MVVGSSPTSIIAKNIATLAQLVEHSPCKRMVVGSSPTSGSIEIPNKITNLELLSKINSWFVIFFGQIPERSNGADCKSAGYAFGGSNPSLPTKFYIFSSKFTFRNFWIHSLYCSYTSLEFKNSSNKFFWLNKKSIYAQVVELVDTLVLETSA